MSGFLIIFYFTSIWHIAMVLRAARWDSGVTPAQQALSTLTCASGKAAAFTNLLVYSFILFDRFSSHLQSLSLFDKAFFSIVFRFYSHSLFFLPMITSATPAIPGSI